MSTQPLSTQPPAGQPGPEQAATGPRAVEAVVFDVDGTLVDTEPAWDVVRRRLAAEDGIAWPETSTTAMMGMSTQEWSTHLAEVVGLKGTAEDSARRTIDGMREYYRAGVELLPGARESVQRMAAHFRIGIASSSPVVLIETAMERLGITELVEAYVSTEQVERGKPAPDGYLRCCELLGVDPTRAVAIEDSANGIRSALDAGMACVAIPQPFHAPPAELVERCTELATLDELTVELVRGL